MILNALAAFETGSAGLLDYGPIVWFLYMADTVLLREKGDKDARA